MDMERLALDRRRGRIEERIDAARDRDRGDQHRDRMPAKDLRGQRSRLGAHALRSTIM
jgi:hypothetical protein